MSMVVYDPEKQMGLAARLRRALPLLSALVFVVFVAGAVVAIFVFGVSRSGVPETLAFTEAEPEQMEAVEDELIEVELDEDGTADEIFVESVDGPATAEVDDTTLRIEPESDAVGTVTVVVNVCDDAECTTRTIVAEVTSRNDPPLAGADQAELAAGEQIIRIPVLANDSDVDDASLEIVDVGVVQGVGEVEIVESGSALEFRTTADAVGPWQITYVVTDGGGGFDQGTATIADGDSAPEPVDDAAEAIVGQQIQIAVLENDSDDAGVAALQVVEVSQPDEGSTEFSSTSVVFTAGAAPGETAFEYVVADAKGQRSTATVTIDVTAPALVVVADTASTREDTPIDVNVLANDGPAAASIDPATLTVISASSGTVAAGGGQISYVPPADAAGEAIIVYEVCSEFGECGQATLTITVEGVIDGAFSSDGEIRVPSNAGPQLIPWLAVSSGEATPPPGSRFQISANDNSLFSANPTIDRNGALFFTPRPGRTGTATTTISATDPVNGQRVFEIRIVVT